MTVSLIGALDADCDRYVANTEVRSTDVKYVYIICEYSPKLSEADLNNDSWEGQMNTEENFRNDFLLIDLSPLGRERVYSY